MTADRQLSTASWTAYGTTVGISATSSLLQPRERLVLTIVQRRKLQYFGRVIRSRNLCTELLEEIRGEEKTGQTEAMPKTGQLNKTYVE